MEHPRHDLDTRGSEHADGLERGVTLPVKETALISSGAKATTTLSSWGEQFVVGVPPAAATITSSKITG
jgi:hypothetical protein